MTRRLPALAAALAAALALPAAAAADVSLRKPDLRDHPHVEVTAVTSAPTATPPELRENGRLVAGFEAQNLGEAKSVVLAIDRSQSMQGQAIDDAVSAARRFIAAKPSGDRISIVTVGREADQLTKFSSATIDADLALRGLDTDLKYGTALWDSVVLSSAALGREELPGRVMILLTDGQEISSEASLTEAITVARKAGVSVYVIGIESSKFKPAPLKRLAAATGGSYYGAASTAALRDVYSAIAAELARTWRLEYVTAGRPGEKLELTARSPDLGIGTLEVVVPGGKESGKDGGGLLPSSLYSSGWSALLVGLAVGLLVLLAFSLLARARRGSWLHHRLAPHLEQRRAVKKKLPSERFATGAALLQATEQAFSHLRSWRSVQRLLERADLPLKTVEFLYISLGSAFLCGFVVLVSGRGALFTLIGFLVGASLPFGFASVKARRRRNAIEDALPDALLTMAASLKAGHSFKSALQTIVDDSDGPAAKEFNRVLTETRLGRPMDEALSEMSDRVGSKNVEFVVTAVTVQGQVGGSLAGLFDMVAEAVRNRQQFTRKIKGLTAMGRASAYVLIALPFALAALLTLLNPSYMEPLWFTSTGHKMLAGMIFMMAIGSLMLKKIVSFKG